MFRKMIPKYNAAASINTFPFTQFQEVDEMIQRLANASDYFRNAGVFEDSSTQRGFNKQKACVNGPESIRGFCVRSKSTENPHQIKISGPEFEASNYLEQITEEKIMFDLRDKQGNEISDETTNIDSETSRNLMTSIQSHNSKQGILQKQQRSTERCTLYECNLDQETQKRYRTQNLHDSIDSSHCYSDYQPEFDFTGQIDSRQIADKQSKQVLINQLTDLSDWLQTNKIDRNTLLHITNILDEIENAANTQ